jgi:SAM-dependent methyltransferase
MEKDQYEILYRLEETHWWYLGMRRMVDALLTRYLDRGRPLHILDAGCGTGGMLNHLRRFGSVVGLDFSDEALGFCRRRGLPHLARGSVERLPFADESFDLLTSFDVLYHMGVEDDRLALGEFRRVLKPGGLLLLRLPAYDWLRGAHDVAVHTRHRYSREELARKLRDADFQIQKLTYANTLLFPIAALKRMVEGTERSRRPDLEPLPAPINRALLGILSIEPALLRKVSFPWGLSLMAVAAKPRC